MGLGLVCELEYGIFSTFIDSESFGLYSLIRTVELNMESHSQGHHGSWDTSGSSFVSKSLQEIRFRPMYTMSGLKRERGLYETVTEPVSSSPAVHPIFRLALLVLCDDRVGGGHAVGHWSIQGAGLNPWVRP